MAAVKAAGTAGLIFFNEKLRTKNKAAAVRPDDRHELDDGLGRPA